MTTTKLIIDKTNTKLMIAKNNPITEQINHFSKRNINTENKSQWVLKTDMNMNNIHCINMRNK